MFDLEASAKITSGRSDYEHKGWIELLWSRETTLCEHCLRALQLIQTVDTFMKYGMNVYKTKYHVPLLHEYKIVLYQKREPDAKKISAVLRISEFFSRTLLQGGCKLF